MCVHEWVKVLQIVHSNFKESSLTISLQCICWVEFSFNSNDDVSPSLALENR